jgi:hypothetical protein
VSYISHDGLVLSHNRHRWRQLGYLAGDLPKDRGEVATQGKRQQHNSPPPFTPF